MKDSKADNILPEELLIEIQQYVQGKTLYIPKPKDNHKKWGDNTQGKTITSARNSNIRSAFQRGVTIEELSKQYFLSSESIKKIVYRKT